MNTTRTSSKSAQTYLKFLDIETSPIMILDGQGHARWINSSFEEMFDVERDEVEGMLVSAILVTSGVSNEDAESVVLCIRRQRSFSLELGHVDTCGHQRWYLVNGNCIGKGPDASLFILRFVDVTDYCNLNTSLDKTKRLLNQVISHIPHAISWKDEGLNYIGCNDSFAEFIGVEGETSRGGGISHFAWELVGMTDHDMPWAPGEVEEFRQQEEKVLRSGESILSVEKVLKNAQGEDRNILISRMPIESELGEDVLGIVNIYTDTTNVLQMEQQLSQARRLEAIGQLAAGIAHEINTPMQYIGDNLRFLTKAVNLLLDLATTVQEVSEDASLPPGFQDKLKKQLKKSRFTALQKRVSRSSENALEGVEAVNKIVRAMKGFSHPGAKEMMASDLNEALQTTATVSRNEWKYVAEMVFDLDPDLPLVVCDLGELNQVFLNLVVNSAHAIGDNRDDMDPKGQITLSTKKDGTSVVIKIQDNGPGIPPEIREKVFDPFFTTKEVGRGTGQGLAIARSIVVERHNGHIALETEQGVGTTFILTIPIEQPREEGA